MRTKLLILAAALLVSGAAQAKLGGKNVVLVHGLQPTHVAGAPNDAGLQRDANEYWEEYWASRAEAILFWSANDRVAGGIKDDMRTQILRLEAQGTCRDGCVFVTHSTGDLVLRDALTRLGQWGVNPNNFKVIAALDFAGAGGGTELAQVAVNVATGGGVIDALARSAVNLFLGFTPNANNLGVLNDLRPAAARNIAISNQAAPRLRFVGSGDDFFRVTKGFLAGFDDSVVAFHSACGARFVDSYESCSRSIRNNGVIRSSDGPSSFYFNHYPVLMGENTDHSEAISNERSGHFTTVVNNTTRGVRLDFATSTRRQWWAGFRKVRRVRDGNRKSMSANVFDTLNR